MKAFKCWAKCGNHLNGSLIKDGIVAMDLYVNMDQILVSTPKCVVFEKYVKGIWCSIASIINLTHDNYF